MAFKELPMAMFSILQGCSSRLRARSDTPIEIIASSFVKKPSSVLPNTNSSSTLALTIASPM
ncbi:hypothetical protein D3C87_1882770 [compost metagenome]